MTGPTKEKPKKKTRTANESGQTRRDKNRRVRREELRLYLSNQGLIPKVIEISRKLSDMRTKLPQDKVYRLKAAADINLKLINKYLGDDKTLEVLNTEDNPITIRPIQYGAEK